jgi:GDSL-like lipase/acylhydrolase family protein
LASERGINISLWRKILYAVTIGAIVLGVCEGGLRIRQRIRYGSAATAVRDSMLVYDAEADLLVPRPGYEVASSRINIKINSLGFRGDEISREKPGNTVRLVCLGASTTFCAEVSSNRATWPFRLQKRLEQAYPGVHFEVVNAAVAGYVAADNLKNLQHRVLPLTPDLVIYYEANNEIVRDTGELAVREGLVQRVGRSPVATSLSKYSLLFDLTSKNLAILSRSRGTSAGTLDRVPGDLPNHFVSVLDQMRASLAGPHVTFVLSTFLPKYRRNQDRPTQVANADVAFYYMPWMSIDGMLDAMDVYNQAILDYGQRAHIPVVDDRDAVPADAVHYADCMHLTDAGADAMAQRFFRYLRNSGTLAHALAHAGAASIGPTAAPQPSVVAKR